MCWGRVSLQRYHPTFLEGPIRLLGMGSHRAHLMVQLNLPDLELASDGYPMRRMVVLQVPEAIGKLKHRISLVGSDTTNQAARLRLKKPIRVQTLVYLPSQLSRRL